MMRIHCRRPSFALFAAALILAAAACSSDDEPESVATDPPTTGVADAAAPAVEPTDPPAGADAGAVAGAADRSADLIGRWEVTDYELPVGGRTNVVGEQPVFLEFAAGGTLAFHTGCNEWATSYTTSGAYYVPESGLDDTPEGQTIDIGPDFEQRTDAFCEGFLGDQDVDLPADLDAATRFVFIDDRLGLLDEFFLVEATR